MSVTATIYGDNYKYTKYAVSDLDMWYDQFCDFADSLLNLKEFLKLRDESELFEDSRAAGRIGIPCILREDGSLTLNWRGCLK